MMLTILRVCWRPPSSRRRCATARKGKLKPTSTASSERRRRPEAYQQAMLAFQRRTLMPLLGCRRSSDQPIYTACSPVAHRHDLRQQPFLFMGDLSQPDSLFGLPFWPHHFNIMPILWIGMFVWFQLRMPLPTDPQQRQMQQMMRFMPILFGVMLYSYASGLMVYMVTSMLWTFGESAITKKILGPVDPSAVGKAPSPMM
jgi:YidC/Oxa1 family membrane protein insertase